MYSCFVECDNRQLSFANKAQFLLVNSGSVEWLRSKIPKDSMEENLSSTINRFRPNLIVELSHSFEENKIEEFLINNIQFKVRPISYFTKKSFIVYVF